MISSPETEKKKTLGWDCFPDFLQNFSEHQILWRMCLVFFLAFILRLPIQTSLSVLPNSQFLCVQMKNVTNSVKQAHPWKLRLVLLARSPSETINLSAISVVY